MRVYQSSPPSTNRPPLWLWGSYTDACIKRRTLYRWWPTYSVTWVFGINLPIQNAYIPLRSSTCNPKLKFSVRSWGLPLPFFDSSRSFSSVSCLPFLQDPCMHPYRELTYWYFWYIESLNHIHAGHALMWICDEGGELTSTLQVNLHLNPWPLRILRSCHPFFVKDP